MIWLDMEPTTFKGYLQIHSQHDGPKKSITDERASLTWLLVILRKKDKGMTKNS